MWRFHETLYILFLTSTVFCSYSKNRVYIDKETSGYKGVTISISSEINASDCPQILADLKSAFIEASESLFNALENRAYFSSIEILVPRNWTASDCKIPLLKSSGKQAVDFFVGKDHPVYKRAPWTQHSLGCGKQGDFIFLPASFIWSSHHKDTTQLPLDLGESNSTQDESGTKRSLKCGDEIRDRWLQYRFGVFSSDLDRVPVPGSSQDSFCLGRSPREIIDMHPDMKMVSRPIGSNPFGAIIPTFEVRKVDSPRYVIVLENSAAMNVDNEWDLLRTATKKFIIHDLPADAQLGLVLFNDGAHIAHTVGTLSDSMTRRNGIAVQIESKYSLSPKSESCVRCGIFKAIEALQSSGSNVGATLILISQGKSTSLSSNSEQELLTLATKHRLQIFSIAIPTFPYTDISLSLERLAHSTGGLSFYVTEKSALNKYVGLIEAFREIQVRTQDEGPFLIHENHFDSFGPSEETGSFVIDKYIGHQTAFNCLAMYPNVAGSGYVKSLMLQDWKGNRFKGIVDSMAYYNILSLFNVPFEADQNIGMNWTYTLERLAASLENVGGNSHVIQVISKPRKENHEFINLKFFTNLETHSIDVNIDNPVIFFVEAKLNEVPVLDARVRVQIDVVNLSGHKTDGIIVELYDSGNGDPDITANDGVYSRYLSDFDLGEGRYEVSVFVDDNAGRAFSFQRERSYGACCKNLNLAEYENIINQKLGTFQRILRGDSFRVHSIQDSNSLPPSRVLDLAVTVHHETHELEFTWTAPGEDYDAGQVSSYRLYTSPTVGLFYTNLNSTSMVEDIQATKISGRRESYRMKAVDFNKNIFYVIVPVDKNGNSPPVSNVQGAFMPSPEPESKTKESTQGLAALTDRNDDVIVTNYKKPDKIVVFLAVGVLSFLLLCILSVIFIVFFNRRKKSGDDLSSEEHSIYVDNDDHFYGGDANTYSVKSTIYDEQEIAKAFEKRQFLTSSNLTDSSNQVAERNFCNNLTSSNTFNSSWINTVPNTQPVYSHPSYNSHPSVQQQPLYATPIPKSQRSRMSELQATSSPKVSSSDSCEPREIQESTREPIYSNDAIQNLVDTLTQEFANENAMSYLEGTTTFVDQYYSNLFNLDDLSQSSADSQQPQTSHQQHGTIKSILKKRDNSSNEQLNNDASRLGSESSKSSQDSKELRVVEPEEQNREIDEILTDLSPSKVFLETSFEASRPPLIQEVIPEDEEAEAKYVDVDELPPPPSPLIQELPESFMTPTKGVDNSSTNQIQTMSEKKKRTITQV